MRFTRQQFLPRDRRHYSIESLEPRMLLTIAAPVSYGVGPSPDPYIPNAADASEVTADFNGDKKLDLVISHTSNNSVYFLKGNGNGTFAPAVQINIGQAIQGDVFAGDFNGDGKLDLFLPSANNQAIVLLGNGDGTFKAPIVSSSFSDPGYYPRGWTVGDFNNDKKLDIAFGLPSGSADTGDFGILLGNGDGTFKAATFGTPGIVSYARWVTTGDFNHDGNTDLAFADGQGTSTTPGDAEMTILLGNGNGTFRLGGHYASPQYPNGDGWEDASAVSNPENIVVADLTGNGIQDVVESDYSSTINVFMGNGNGTFQPAVSYDPGNYPRNVVPVDINHDGKIDLVVTNVGIGPGGAIFNQVGAQAGSVSILLGYGDGTFAQPITYSPSAYPGYTAVGDFNGDGYPDLAVSQVLDGNRVNVMLNNPTSQNLPPTFINPPSASAEPVIGKTTVLSALGNDDGGASNIAYTWSTIGAIPGAVTYNANGTNSAKNTTVTFTKPGAYLFQCKETDKAGLPAIKVVLVTVSSTLSRIVVSPATPSVPANGQQQFSAIGYDQFGVALATQPTFGWSVSGGGTITAGGLFTAGSSGGGPFTVTARSGSISAVAKVTVLGSTNGGTLTFYSLAGDGRVRDFGDPGIGLSYWNTVHGAADGNEADPLSPDRANWAGTGALFGPAPGEDGVDIMRGYLDFDTSGIPANAVITSAAVGVYITGKYDSISDGNDFIAFVQGFQASGSTLVVGDYSKAGNAITNPTEGSNRLTIPSLLVNAYNTWTLNSAGLTWIARGGIAKLDAREGHDLLNAWPNYTAGTGDVISADMSETPGTTMDPYLRVTYTIPTKPAITKNPVSQTVTAGQTVTFTVSASGYPTPKVQWQVSIDGGKTYTNLAGATSTTHRLTASTALNGHRYRAVFTNSQGSAATVAALLTVKPAATIADVVATKP